MLFILVLLQSVEKNTSDHVLRAREPLTTMAGTRDDHTGHERCANIMVAVSGALQIYRYTGRKREKSGH